MRDITRLFDIVISFIALLLLSPLLCIIAVAVKLNSRGPSLFRQVRVGRDNKDFIIYKFRTMHTDAHLKYSLTVGKRDTRITAIGYYLRRYKLDELPQLYNVLKGDMSLVGPRPELRKYVDMYSPQQKKILSVRPGITDYASILYRNENELLANAENPELYYIQHIMPRKLELNNKYLLNKSVSAYFHILSRTFLSLFH
ncbi:sugar transferase [Foetidibacter luteolus]|uniref:sugar transferase n=1 Tax=Foetidibacter luteolus TaxID=2608880 RepID=UPI001A994E9D|nr:sugar transferase [Foetidibacter luteolus]